MKTARHLYQYLHTQIREYIHHQERCNALMHLHVAVSSCMTELNRAVSEQTGIATSTPKLTAKDIAAVQEILCD